MLYKMSIFQLLNIMPILAIFLFLYPIALRADYADVCTTTDGILGKCMPIASCRNIEAKFEDAAILEQFNCGKYNGVQHVCCVPEQIQYNSETMKMLSEIDCGRSKAMRVAEGTEVKLGTRPWMALLRYRTFANRNAFLCGGTLISDRYILTAAHCIPESDDQLYQVRLGEHKISTERDCIFLSKHKKCADPVEDINIEKIFVHDSYTDLNIYNDIALIRLEHAPKNKTYIKPICLPITKELQQMADTLPSFYVTGWGATENSTLSDVLLEASLANTERSKCKEAFNYEIRSSQICAGGNGLKDSCKGDSGGPIQYPANYLQKQRMVQFGIVSKGVVTCGSAGLPAIYTSVSEYIQWITDVLNSK